MKKGFFTVLLITLFLTSCMTTDLVSHNDLRDNSKKYEVKREFTFFNKSPRLSFGDYQTKVIESGNHSYKYELYDSVNKGFIISCSPFKNGKNFQLTDISFWGNTKDEYYIRVFDNCNKIVDIKYEGRFNTTFFYNNQQYRLIEEDESDINSNSLFIGYVIKHKGETLAAMNLNGDEIIWLHDSLNSEQEMVLSGVLTAISLKPVIDEE